MICRIAKFYGGATSFRDLEIMPFDELSMLWDEMRWHERELDKSMKRRTSGI